MKRRKLTDEGLVVLLSFMLVPSAVLICFEDLLLIGLALLWGAFAIVLAKIWSPGWANKAGEHLKGYLDE